MKLKFLGAAGTVTGSSYVLTSSGGQSILIDMGMFQGPEEIEALNHESFDYSVDQLSHALLTHAHLDHCGRLPMLDFLGFNGQVWMTPPTKPLAELVLFDSAKIAERYHDKPLYTKENVENLIDRFKTIDYNKPKTLGDFEVTFVKAGHLLGAASIVIKDTTSEGGIGSIVFSGDLGNKPEELLQEFETIKEADVVVMESTYGDRLHSDADPHQLLLDEIVAAENDASTLLIPSFSLEKTQELLYMIKHYKKQGKVGEETPVYLDSPMALSATGIYKSHSKYMNHKLKAEAEDPYGFPGLQIIYKHYQSQKIKEEVGTKVIIAGAGMMTGGRIVSHAAQYLSDPKNRLFFVGYQGEQTLGREILEGLKLVTINDEQVEIKAHINKTDGMSAHADQSQLLEWLKAIGGVKKVVVTHGEDQSRSALAQKITQDLGIQDIHIPKLNEEIGF